MTSYIFEQIKEAKHIAGEFATHFTFDCPCLPTIALSTYGSVHTAIGNDNGIKAPD